MIKEFESTQIKEILCKSKASDPLPRYSDKERWEQILKNPMFSFEGYEDFLNKQLAEPITHVPASLYLNFFRTGNRNPHDGIVSSRRSRLVSLALGECIERKGRFMDAIMDLIWAICEESSWVIPAHSRTTLPEYTDIRWIDLVSAETARTLAEVIFILGERLDEHNPMIRQRALYEIDRRCWTPYMKYDDMWWMFAKGPRAKLNNWTAVCNCGVVGSALLVMDDIDMLSKMIEKCLRSMNDFLKCFDSQGGCDEGPGYWAYGVSNYVWLSYLLEMRTEGKVSLMDAPEMIDIAMFPQRTTLSGTTVVNFSDCSPNVSFSPSLMFYIGDRLKLPQVSAFAQYQYDLLGPVFPLRNVRDLVWMPSSRYLERWKPESHFFYPDMQWMISRSDPNNDRSLMLAVKGGHNAENHNQNDIGNFIVHYGGESLIIDLGAGAYTRDYFSSRRYEILVNSSWGHNVPLVNGHQQPAGANYYAKVIDHGSSEEKDFIELDMTNAYPREAKIESLVRKVSLLRTKEEVTLEDSLRLQEPAGSWKCPVYTSGQVSKSSSNELKISGNNASISVKYFPNTMDPVIETVDPSELRSPKQVNRIIFEIPIEDREGIFKLTMSPLK